MTLVPTVLHLKFYPTTFWFTLLEFSYVLDSSVGIPLVKVLFLSLNLPCMLETPIQRSIFFLYILCRSLFPCFWLVRDFSYFLVLLIKIFERSDFSTFTNYFHVVGYNSLFQWEFYTSVESVGFDNWDGRILVKNNKS